MEEQGTERSTCFLTHAPRGGGGDPSLQTPTFGQEGGAAVRAAQDLRRFIPSHEEVAAASGWHGRCGWRPSECQAGSPPCQPSKAFPRPQEAAVPAGIHLPVDLLGSLAWNSARAHSLPPLQAREVLATLCQERPPGPSVVQSMMGYPRRSCSSAPKHSQEPALMDQL